MGAYVKGSDPNLDKAILARDKIRKYMEQGMNEQVSYEESTRLLSELAKSFTGR